MKEEAFVELTKRCSSSLVTMVNVMYINFGIMKIENSEVEQVMKSNLYSIIPISKVSIRLIDKLLLNKDINKVDYICIKEFEFSLIDQLYSVQDVINDIFNSNIKVDKSYFF